MEQLSRPNCLVSGCKQVEKFASDDEYEDEEVTYVTLDLGVPEPTLVPSSSTYRLIGLDTATPFLQLSGTIFKGQHNILLGTELLFTDDTNVHHDNKRGVAHLASTSQRIAFKEVRLVPKGEGHAAQENARTDGPGRNKVRSAAAAVGATQEDSGDVLDRLTGKVAPVPRKPGRRKKVAAAVGDDVDNEDKGKKPQRKSRKGKEKARDTTMDIGPETYEGGAAAGTEGIITFEGDGMVNMDHQELITMDELMHVDDLVASVNAGLGTDATAMDTTDG